MRTNRKGEYRGSNSAAATTAARNSKVLARLLFFFQIQRYAASPQLHHRRCHGDTLVSVSTSHWRAAALTSAGRVRPSSGAAPLTKKTAEKKNGVGGVIGGWTEEDGDDGGVGVGRREEKEGRGQRERGDRVVER